MGLLRKEREELRQQPQRDGDRRDGHNREEREHTEDKHVVARLGWLTGTLVAFEQREVLVIGAPEDVADISGDRYHANERVDHRVHDHAQQDDLRDVLPCALDDQDDRKDGADQISQPGDQRQDRIKTEPDVRQGNPKPRIQELGPTTKRSQRNHHITKSPNHQIQCVQYNPSVRVWPGSPFPLGATWNGFGVNFALFSAHATKVELCLFDGPDARVEAHRVRIVEQTNFVWHAFLPDVRPGQIYGYRVSGPWNPAQGHRFNPTKVLLDPYARAFGRLLAWDRALLGYKSGTDGNGEPSDADSAPFAALGIVEASDSFDWGSDRRLGTPWTDTIIYELHVKGFTALNPAVPKSLRGTFLGLSSAPAIGHLKSLGVTAVELMPVHAHAAEWRLVQSGRPNYWGYNTLSYFIPDPRFVSSRSPADAIREFKTMVQQLHGAGLEVILDVVYNHTAEGDHLGPTLSWRGIDNRSYYRLDPARPERYEDFTGCGSTLDVRTPRVLQLIMDSLRYWVEEMHVDGFRFDLASALARDSPAFDPRAGFLDIVLQDPAISGVKLIAEPWDLGDGGYQVGRFPAGWTEWNNKYRDDVRRFWRGDKGMLPALATRLAGSSDLYAGAGRSPEASLNFVTSHDGFTLADLVAYASKHNEANGEENRDGDNNNFSANNGVEGPTGDPAILEMRTRQRRNFLATLMLSLGVPMLSGGDEAGRSQSGNNNGYCEDSPLVWTPWNDDEESRAFLAFVQSIVAFRKAHGVLRRRRFLDGAHDAVRDVLWIRPDGAEMAAPDWADPERLALGMILDGRALRDQGPHGESVQSATIAGLFNAERHPVIFMPPARPDGELWEIVIDTAAPLEAPSPLAGSQGVTVEPHAVVVLRASHLAG